MNLTDDKVPEKPLISKLADGMRNSPYLKTIKYLHDLDTDQLQQKMTNSILGYNSTPNYDFPQLDSDHWDRQYEHIAKKEREDFQHKQAQLLLLQTIAKNTNELKVMTSLLQDSNEKQDEILKLMVEIAQIEKSSSPEEAESRWNTIKTKIETVTDSVSMAQTLYGMAMTAYKAFQSLNS
jgi:leucyl aminopeptidase